MRVLIVSPKQSVAQIPDILCIMTKGKRAMGHSIFTSRQLHQWRALLRHKKI